MTARMPPPAPPALPELPRPARAIMDGEVHTSGCLDQADLAAARHRMRARLRGVSLVSVSPATSCSGSFRCLRCRQRYGFCLGFEVCSGCQKALAEGAKEKP